MMAKAKVDDMEIDKKNMKRAFIVDEEISLLEEKDDLLKTKIYADNLAEAILNTPSERVFTIGVFGSWGTGKSSIIKTAQEEIKNKKIKFITYDAWKYANDSFRRMFLLKIQQELKCETDEMKRFYQSETIESEPKTYFSFRGIVVCLIAQIIALIIIKFFINIDIECNAVSIISLINLLTLICNGVLQELKIQIRKPELFAPEQFEQCFWEIVNNSFTNKNLEKLVIVIDNIDRCHNSMAYQLLIDIKSFFSDQNQDKKYNLVFVVPVDDEALRQNLFNNKSKNSIKEKEEFLRKIFNLTIKIKPHQSTELNAYAKNLNKKWKLGFNDDTIALCSKEFATNPRRIIQLFNNLTSELELYKKDGNFAKDYESAICAILILREEYKDFYNLIVKEVSKLLEYTDDRKNKNLSAFMRIAAPIFRNTKAKDLLHIINNSNAVFEQIPIEVRNSIESYDAEEVILQLGNRQRDLFVDYIKKCTGDNIKSNAGSQITNSLVFISNVFTHIEVNPTVLREFDFYFQDIYKNFIDKIDKSKLENLCKYANLLAENNLSTLKESIMSRIINIDISEGNAILEEAFIITVFSVFKSKDDSVKLKDFATKLFDKTSVYMNLSYSTEQFEYLFSDELIQSLINKLTLNSKAQERDELLWLLEKKTNIKTDTYISLFNKISGLIGQTTDKNKTQILSYIEYSYDFIKLTPDKCFENNTNINNLYSKLIFRLINNKQIDIIGECLNSLNSLNNSNNLNLVIDFIVGIYRISNLTIIIPQNNNIVSVGNKYICSKLIDLKNRGYLLRPFSYAIMTNENYSSDEFMELTEFCMQQENTNENLIKNKIDSLLNNISNKNVQESIQRLTENPELKPVFIKNIVDKGSKFINDLPKSLLDLAVKSFNKETSSSYAENIDFLSVVAKNANSDQESEIAKILTEHINKNSKNIPRIFSILQEISFSEEHNKEKIHAALLLYKNSNNNINAEQLDNLILKYDTHK